MDLVQVAIFSLFSPVSLNALNLVLGIPLYFFLDLLFNFTKRELFFLRLCLGYELFLHLDYLFNT